MPYVLQLITCTWLLLAAVTHAADEDCPPMESMNATDVSSPKLIRLLTHQCRYDRLVRPGNKQEPLNVSTRAYIYLIQSDSQTALHFTVHLLLQFRYDDPRLAYEDIAPHIREVVGETELKERIWIPHIYLSNEHSSAIMGTQAKDEIVTIYPDGTVIFAFRVRAVLFCYMRLEKFPFDEQKCPLTLESWTYNATELLLDWEYESPVILNPALHLTEYTLIDMWTNKSNNAYFPHGSLRGPFHGNYSSLSITFHLSREMGFYMMDYYVPSILLVVISWVSFWLEANAPAARIALGTSTMLTFITLASKTSSQLPKVSYIKASEIWFLGCTAFIFGSLVEFAFVNTIYRRKRNVELVKADAKNILKSAVTPRLARKQLMQHQGSSLERSSSCPDMDNALSTTTLTVQSSASSLLDIPGSVTTYKSDMTNHNPSIASSIEITVPMTNSKNSPPPNASLTTMTPQQISQWIDRRSRFFFPAAFLVFNVLYWSFLWI